MAKKFNNQPFEDLFPSITRKYSQGCILPKALPALPKPIFLQNLNMSELTDTDSMIGLEEYRKSKSPATGDGFCAALIDTGVSEHQYLEKKIIKAVSANGDITDVKDLYGHGTHLAGIIAAKNFDNIPGIGIAPGAKIFSIKVTRRNSGEASWSSICRALELVLEIAEKQTLYFNIKDKDKKEESKINILRDVKDNHVKLSVVNLSFNGLDSLVNNKNSWGHRIFILIEKLSDHNIPVVISSGNLYEQRTRSGHGYPACGETAIHVGSLFNYDIPRNNSNTFSTFSQRIDSVFEEGTNLSRVRRNTENFIQAPGSLSISASHTGKNEKTYLHGTSISAAIVTSAILILQEEAKNTLNRELTVAEIRQALIDGSRVFVNENPHPNNTSTGNPRQDMTAYINNRRYYDSKLYCCLNIPKSITALSL